MSMSKAVIHKGLKHVLEPKTVHAGYIVDERGNEVQITASMIRNAAINYYNSAVPLKADCICALFLTYQKVIWIDV